VPGHVSGLKVLRGFEDAGWTSEDAPRGMSLLSPDGTASVRISGPDRSTGVKAPIWVRPEPYTIPNFH
jgi:hypothetical protein